MDNEKLLKAIQERRILYDKTDPKHSDREWLQREWEAVAEELNVEVDAAKKRWAYLRDYFRKQHRVLELVKIGRAPSRKKRWPLFDSMSFLLPYSKPININIDDDFDFCDAVSEGSITTDCDDENDNDDEESFKRPDTGTRSTHLMSKKRKAPSADFEGECISVDTSQKPLVDEQDENEHFLKSILPMMKTLEQLEAMEFRHEVQGLLIQYIKRARLQLPSEHTATASASSIVIKQE
ncbi:uncharacterized protein LOC106013315 [Aplysia californica]|uniref:Uncharacterized protein LOC106013315 n=1 Tax=Aplysia californica TaxID=6500 RepID=A0ABM1AAT7_APLCA|nr:uncharacterized protein LOC106013315 [Aplysia californica]